MNTTGNLCKYYVMCANKADGYTEHPILGNLPTCKRCANLHGLKLIPFEPKRNA